MTLHFSIASSIISYPDHYHFKKDSFLKQCLFHYGYKPWGYIPFGPKMMPFLLGLSLNIEHSLNSEVLFSVSHMLYLEAVATQWCSLKCVSLKLGKPDTLNKDTKA